MRNEKILKEKTVNTRQPVNGKAREAIAMESKSKQRRSTEEEGLRAERKQRESSKDQEINARTRRQFDAY